VRGEYAAIHEALPDDPEFQRLGPGARLLWYTLRLMLGPSGIDILRAHETALEEPTGLDAPGIARGLDELEAGRWLVREGDVLWLRNVLRYNPHMTTRNERHRTGILKHLQGLPRYMIVRRFADYYGLPDPFPGEVSDSHSDSHSDSLPDSHSVPYGKHETRDTTHETRDTRHDTGHRSNDTRTPDAVVPDARRSDTPGQNGRLESFLGEHADCLDGVPETALPSIWGWYRPLGTRERTWREIDPERIPGILASSILAWKAANKGGEFYAPFFHSIVEREAERVRTEGSEAAAHTSASENDREATRRARAHVEEVDARARERLQAEGAETLEQANAARDWLTGQPPGVQQSVAMDLKAGLLRLGWRGDPRKAPPALSAPIIVEAVKKARAAREVAT